MLNSHKFSEKNCKILKTKLVRSIFIYLEFQKKSSVTALRKVFSFFFFFFKKKQTKNNNEKNSTEKKVFFFGKKLVSLTKNWGDFICSLVFMLAYCV